MPKTGETDIRIEIKHVEISNGWSQQTYQKKYLRVFYVLRKINKDNNTIVVFRKINEDKPRYRNIFWE